MLDGELCQDSGACTVYYLDADGDGYGDPNVFDRALSQPEGWVLDTSDCDDNDATINPDGTDVCNNSDDDCNGQVDDNADASCDDGVTCTQDACDGARNEVPYEPGTPAVG